MILRCLAGCAALALALAAALVLAVKPARTLLPEVFGLHCDGAGLCIDDPGRLDLARALRADALDFVVAGLGPLRAPPRMIFCADPACFARFGDPRISGQYVTGTATLVINAKGWHPHIVRHEVIHHWQAEVFGRYAQARGLPRWYIEGMAYVLSADPRAVIPHPAAEAQRLRFAQWLAAGGDLRAPPNAESAP